MPIWAKKEKTGEEVFYLAFCEGVSADKRSMSQTVSVYVSSGLLDVWRAVIYQSSFNETAAVGEKKKKNADEGSQSETSVNAFQEVKSSKTLYRVREHSKLCVRDSYLQRCCPGRRRACTSRRR